ncbi:hypothetical protein QF037_009993 [Streptomyces canus]|nr:hypothetical protein [Streptomyces canus]
MPNTSPSADAPPAQDDAAPHRLGYVHALERVQIVASWYTRQISQEREAASPDQDRIDELVAGLRQCITDQRSLPSADPASVARISADYAALYRDLGSR